VGVLAHKVLGGRTRLLPVRVIDKDQALALQKAMRQFQTVKLVGVGVGAVEKVDADGVAGVELAVGG